MGQERLLTLEPLSVAFLTIFGKYKGVNVVVVQPQLREVRCYIIIKIVSALCTSL